MDKPQIIVHSEQSLNYTPFDVKWLPKSAKVIVLGTHAKGTGIVQIYEMCQGNLNKILDIERPKALKCGTFAASSFEDRHLAVGDFDGRLEVMDLTAPNLPVFVVKAHSEIINTIDGVGGLNIGKGAPELATGSRDGQVRVWDTRQQSPVVTILPEEGGGRDCWTVAFGNAWTTEERTLGAGFDNGDVKVFDLRTQHILWETNVRNGVCALQFDRPDIKANKLAVATLESDVRVYDVQTLHPEKGYACVSTPHSGASSISTPSSSTTVWTLKHLPQNRDVFATTGGNGSVALWKYSYPASRTYIQNDGSTVGVAGELQPLQRMAVTAQPLVAWDWNRDKCGLAACISLDQILRIVIVTKLNTV